MGSLRRSLVEERGPMEPRLLKRLKALPPPRTQWLLADSGHHPGPLFGPLAIKRQAQKDRRSKLYRDKVKMATPPWADMDAIRAVYREAKRLTRETGRPWTVDHVVPLRGEFVWGLHVHYNLRVVPRLVNMSKGNTFDEDQMLLDLAYGE